MNLGAYREDPTADNLAAAALFPLLAVFGFMFYPQGSLLPIAAGSLFSVLLLFLVVLTKMRKWQYYMNWRLGLSLFYVDSAFLFIALLIGRSSGSVWAAIALTSLLVLVAWFSHQHAKRIFEEIRSPRTRLGRLAMSVALIGSGGGAMAGYLLTKGSMAPAALVFLFIAGMYVVSLAHAQFQLIAIEGEAV